MSTTTLPRWIAPLVLIASFGGAALAPAPAHAQSGDSLARVIVDIADVVFRGNDPYYRNGQYDDRLIVVRDRNGRPVYYREAPRNVSGGPPYGNAYGYHRNAPGKLKCDKQGRCTVKGKGKKGQSDYYDARHDAQYDSRYDNRYYDNRYYDRRGDDLRR